MAFLAFSSAAAPANASTFVLKGLPDFIMSGGSSVQAAPLNSLRSGNPGAHTTAAVR